MDDIALGKLLIERGLASREAVREAYAALASGVTSAEGGLGEALVTRGLLDVGALATLRGESLAGSAADAGVTRWDDAPAQPPAARETGRHDAPTVVPESALEPLVERRPGPAPAGRLLQIGQLVEERYRIEALLGRGGMGAVFRARDQQLGILVAIKVILPEVATPEVLKRFEREAQLAAQVDRDEGIVRVFSFGSVDGLPYCVMEFVEGRDLEAVFTEEELSHTRLARILERVARSVAVCHAAGIVHRDLKPGNVLLAAGDATKVLDFGLAVTDAVERLTRTGDLLGTPSYMAPEQADRARDVDARADVYSLGAILYRGLCGRPPFVGSAHEVVRDLLFKEPEPPSRVRAGVPADLEAVCLGALAKELDDRTSSAEALAEDLARFARGDPVDARPLTAWVRFKRRRARGDVAAVALVRSVQAGALLALLGLLSSVYFVWAPGVVDREAVWADAALAGHELGLGRSLPITVDEVARRRATLTRVRFLLDAEETHVADRALAKLSAYARLLAHRAGDPVDVPPRLRAGRLPTDVVVDALVLYERGQAAEALRRLERLLGANASGPRSSFMPARVLQLRINAETGAFDAALGNARALWADPSASPDVRAFVREQAKAAIQRGTLDALRAAPTSRPSALSEALTPLSSLARDLELDLTWLEPLKRAALEESAPAWEERARLAIRALRRGDTAQIREVVGRLGVVVRQFAPPVRPGPKLSSVLDLLGRAPIARYEEVRARGSSARDQGERQLAETALEIGQRLYYEVDPQRAPSPRYFKLLQDMQIRWREDPTLELFLACLRTYRRADVQILSPEGFLARVEDDPEKSATLERLEKWDRPGDRVDRRFGSRAGSLAVGFIRLLVKVGRGRDDDSHARREMIAEARALVEDERGLPDLAPAYVARIHLWLAKFLCDEAVGTSPTEDPGAGLFREALEHLRFARSRVLTRWRHSTFSLEAECLGRLGRRREALALWDQSLALLETERREGRAGVTDYQALAGSYKEKGTLLADLGRTEEAESLAARALATVGNEPERSNTWYRCSALVARLAIDAGRLDDAERALDPLGEFAGFGVVSYAVQHTRLAIARGDSALARACMEKGLEETPKASQLSDLEALIATMRAK